MTDALWSVTLVLAAILLVFTAVALGVGLVAAITNERLARCPRCHRFHLTPDRAEHDGDCPEGPVHWMVHTVGHVHVHLPSRTH